MPVTAVVVGPCAVRTARDSAPEAAAALHGIDDDVVLAGEQPVTVGELWRDLFGALLDDDGTALICPSWWPDRRIATVCDAARAVAATVEVLRRSAVLATAMPRPPGVVVEIADQFVALTRPPAECAARVVVRDRNAADVADEVARLAGAPPAAVVDRATGVAGAHELGALIAERLRTTGTSVTVVDDTRLLRAARHCGVADPPRFDAPPARGRAWPWLGGAAAAGVVVAGIVYGTPRPAAPAPTLLVEGRVVVEVPTGWTARRITSGPGSARVQVTSPTDPRAALHITQSPVPSGETLPHTADALRSAMLDEPPGVFVDFNPADSRGDRQAVTYREIREGHDIRWTVLLDENIRISIGCQSARGREDAVRAACERAIASARDAGEFAGTVAPQHQSNTT